MGLLDQPHLFVDSPAETPDAKKWNDNFAFLNVVQQNLMLNGNFSGVFTGGVPVSWTLVGAGASSASDPDSKEGLTAVLITFGSAPANLEQTSSEFKFFQGRIAKAWCFVKTSTPSQARIRIRDGVGSTDSAFHNGDGTYQLLTVEHPVALGATEVTLELRVESAGSVKFDLGTLVDGSSILGRLINPEDVAAATKEFFWQVTDGNNVGAFPVKRVGPSTSIRFLGRIPHDFNALTSIVMVAIPDSTSGPQTVELTSDKAADGESATADQEQDLTNTFSYTANQMTEFDVSSVFTSIAAGDYVGLLIDRQGAGFGNLDMLGLKLRYT